MIDAATGTLVFDRGTIDKKLTRSAFLNSPLASDAKLILEEEVNRTYQLAQPLHIEKHVVSAQLFFTGESLRAVTLAFIDARFGRSWEDWSEARNWDIGTNRTNASHTARRNRTSLAASLGKSGVGLGSQNRRQLNRDLIRVTPRLYQDDRRRSPDLVKRSSAGRLRRDGRCHRRAAAGNPAA
jgi:hypothetical protein